MNWVWVGILACSTGQSEAPLPKDLGVPLVHAERFDSHLSKGGIWASNHHGIGEQTVLDLLAHPETKPMTSVFINDQRMTAVAVESIMVAKPTATITRLHLAGNPIGDAGLEVLARSPRLAQIQNLNLQNVDATPDGISVLAASEHLRPKTLALGWQQVGDEGAVALSSAPHLQSLSLESAEVGTVGAVALLEKSSIGTLTLSNNPIHLNGLTRVSSSITALYLDGRSLTDADVQILASVEAPGLKLLSLDGAHVLDSGLESIMGSAWFAQLDTLSVGGQKASPRIRKRLINEYKGQFLSVYKKDL